MSSLELFLESPADFMRSLTSIGVRGHAASLMLVAMSLGCRSYKGSNGTQKDSTRRETSAEHGGSRAVVLPSRKRGF